MTTPDSPGTFSPNTAYPGRDDAVKIEYPEKSVALITGGGSGIGLAIAHALAAAGVAVALTGRRAEVLESAIEGIRRSGGRAVAVAGDVCSSGDAARMVAETVAGLGGLHILINNAGIARGGPLDQMSAEDLDAVIDIDLKGPMHMIRAALPELRKSRDEERAAIVNISSSVTLNPAPNFSVYSAAKAGLEMLTRCLALDLAKDRIRVNAIAPGVVETPIFETMMPAKAVSRAMRQFAESTPLGRVGKPTDIARLAVFLAGPQSAWITGAIVPADGGLSLAG